MLTCREFLSELNAYLDESTEGELKAKLDQHMTQCPNCWVVVDTTQKTLKVFKGMEPQPVPPEIQSKLMRALERKIAATRGTASN